MEPDGREWVTIVIADATGDRNTDATGDRNSDRPAPPDSSIGLRAWLAGAPAPGSHEVGQGSTAPTDVRIAPRCPDASFLAMVSDALQAIDGGEVVKVVLARQVDVTMATPIDVPALLRRWQGLEPNCAIFSLPTTDGQFVGASPELLVDRAGSRIHSRPLAGTAERFIGAGGSLLPGELLDSRKDAAEHRLVVRGHQGHARDPLLRT